MKAAFRSMLALCLLATLPGWSQAQTPDYKTWYLAEGSTSVFEEEILIGNPNAVDAEVTITYLVSSGVTAPAPKVITVKAHSRVTVRVREDILVGAVSTKVTSTQPIVVERSMYWGGGQRLGAHNSKGVTAPAVEWFLAEGATGFFDTYILIANPNDKATEVEITFLGPSSATKTVTVTVEANSRRTVNAKVDGGVTFDAFSARLRSLDATAPIIVERAMYWNNFTAGTNETALTALSTEWRFGEGYTASGFETYVLLANPNDQAATVETTFYLEDGTTAVDTREVPAQSRVNIAVNYEVPGAFNKPFSIVARCTNGLAIAAERAMYWNGFREGHAVAGITEEAPGWAFGDGIEDRFNGVDYDTYFLLNNSGDNAVAVTATFLLEDGTGFQDTFNVGARSRYTLIAGRYPALSNRRFAAFFRASGPIVAERSLYWGPNYHAGHASAGQPWPFDVPAPAQAPSGPTVTSLSPAYGPTTGGTDVTIKGTNFGMDTTVTIGGVQATVTVIDAETVMVRTMAAAEGAKGITLRSRDRDATNQPAFTYEKPAPPPPPPPPAGTPNGPARWSPSQVPNFYGLVERVAIQRRDLLISSCREFGGNNEFMFEVVRQLRSETGDNRWGLNWKRGYVGDLSQDIVDYYYGPQGVQMEGRTEVLIFDIIGGHCGSNPSPFWVDQTGATARAGAIGRWTTAGRSF
jgi:hypothetical protein